MQFFARVWFLYIPYFKSILRLSYPIIIGQIGIVAMGVTDVVMIGKIDAVNLAAASLANSIYFLICILGIGTLTAISPLVAQMRGAGKTAECGNWYRQGIVTAVLLTAVVSILVYVLTENMDWFRQSERVTLLTISYLHLLNLGTLPLLIFLAVKQFCDGLSHTRPAAVVTLIAFFMNIFLNYLLIYGNWGFPRMGLAGTGVATDCARGFMAIGMLLWVRFRKEYRTYLQDDKSWSKFSYLREIFRIGLPSGFQYFFEIGAFSSAAIIIGWIGEYAQAAHQIAINVASITYMIATGISAGGSIAVGDALGRKDKTGVIRNGKAALLLGIAFMFCCSLIFALFDRVIVGIYIEDQRVTDIAVYLLWIAALFQMSDGIQCVSLGILRGISDTRMPTAITVVAYWIIGIPFGYYLGFKLGWSIYGVWAALLLGLTFSAVMLSTRFFRLSRNIGFKH